VELGPLDTPERVERVRRSLAMAHFEAPPVYSNDQVLRMLQALVDVLAELRRLRRWCGLEEWHS
jgi:hypothetical protein